MKLVSLFTLLTLPLTAAPLVQFSANHLTPGRLTDAPPKVTTAPDGLVTYLSELPFSLDLPHSTTSEGTQVHAGARLAADYAPGTAPDPNNSAWAQVAKNKTTDNSIRLRRNGPSGALPSTDLRFLFLFSTATPGTFGPDSAFSLDSSGPPQSPENYRVGATLGRWLVVAGGKLYVSATLFNFSRERGIQSLDHPADTNWAPWTPDADLLVPEPLIDAIPGTALGPITHAGVYGHRIAANQQNVELYAFTADLEPADLSAPATPRAVPPGAPGDLTVAATTPRQVELRWTDLSSDETHFQLESHTADQTDWTVIATLAPDTTTFTDRELKPGTTYLYRIRSVRSTTSSAPSNEVTAETN